METRLMESIQEKWGGLIQKATAASSLPPAFLAALIANESGGSADARRFEANVFERLKHEHPDWGEQRQRANATSWGLTQIMGINYPGPPEELADPQTNLNFAVKMLAQFAERWQLDLRSEFEELFHCWNTGRPDAPTYDPQYATNGLNRMMVWSGLDPTDA